MFKLGIVGAENSHCAAIATICNVEKKVAARTVCVWGETKKYAEAAAEKGNIPTIVKDWREMLGQVDGIMIDHRHPLPHYEVAKFFLENKVPVFVDKPMTYRLKHAKELIEISKKKRTAVTTFSIIPMQKNYQQFCKEAKKLGPLTHLTTWGPVDLKTKYGGIFFYGIHQVDAVIELFGTDVQKVNVTQQGEHGVATMQYRNGPIATINLIKNYTGGFHWTATGQNASLNWQHQGDPSPYLTGTKTFLKMFKTGKMPFDKTRMLAPVAVLEAMEKSLKQRKPINVAKLG